MSTSAIGSTAIASDDMAIRPPSPFDEYLTIKQLVELSGKSARYWARMETLSSGPPRTLIGKKILYRLASLREWLQEQEARSHSPRAKRRRRTRK